jgi:hypothetical protein
LHIRYSLTLAACLGAPAFAAGLAVDVNLPRIGTAEYHRPYVAVWVERPDQSVAANLAVWYDTRTKPNGENEGLKYLKDLRQWWRRTGRELQMPIDGVSSATRPAGKQTIEIDQASPALAKLAPGAYTLYVEAAREAGGREILGIPFTWPLAAGASLSAAGNSELGEVRLAARP